MTTTTLGIAVTSNAGTAAADLDKLVVAAEKAEKGAKRVGGASKDMSAALGSITAILSNIERHTATMAAGMNQSATAALTLGKASATAAASMRSMDNVTAKITMDMTELKTAATSVSAAITSEAVAVNVATAALVENTRAANENKSAMAARSAIPGRASSGLNNFNTSNVAAQFQDIGVTAAMGMSPLQIALQQGTQLSAVLGGQGLTGVVRTLGGAFASVFSPVSLLTIGVVALGAAGIQALMGMFQETESATDALERHGEWLDKILIGYDKAKGAAEHYLEEATKLPQGEVELALNTKQDENQKALDDALQQLQRQYLATGVSQDVLNSLMLEGGQAALDQRDALLGIQIAAQAANPDLNAIALSLKTFIQNNPDSVLSSTATEMLKNVEAARQFTAELGSVSQAISAIPRDIQVRISMSQTFSDAMSDVNGLYMDPRDTFDKARDQLKLRSEAAQNSAQSMSELTALATDYQRVLGSIDTAEAKANEKRGATAAKAAQKPVNQWESATESFQQRIEATQLEISTMGQSTEAINRQKAAFDLLNQAKQAGIPITASVTAQINALATESASTTAQLERMTQAANDNSAIWSQAEDGVSSVIKTWAHGGDVLDAIGNKLGDIGDMLIDMAVRDLFGAALGGGGGQAGGGFLSGALGWLGSLFGMPGHAMGTANTGGSVGQPAGIVHGQEAVIPLPSGGKVPVMVQGGSAQNVVVTLAWAKDSDGNIAPIVRGVAQETVANAAPGIAGAARSGAAKDAPAAMARYQSQQAGSDYRV
jgi:hypothetical protein